MVTALVTIFTAGTILQLVTQSKGMTERGIEMLRIRGQSTRELECSNLLPPCNGMLRESMYSLIVEVVPLQRQRSSPKTEGTQILGRGHSRTKLGKFRARGNCPASKCTPLARSPQTNRCRWLHSPPRHICKGRCPETVLTNSDERVCTAKKQLI